MPTIRTLGVDDEKPGRERVRRLLSRDPRVDVVSACAGGAEAVARVRASQTDGAPVALMFLDVQMPEIDGFGVVAALAEEMPPERLPAIVFVTAHDRHALKAFEAHAIDYLLKPFSDRRFRAALDRACRLVTAGQAQAIVSHLQDLVGTGRTTPKEPPYLGAVGQAAPPAVDRILVKGHDYSRLVPADDIAWIEAEGVYVTLHMRDGSQHLHRGLLASLDAVLDPRQFVRIHRSAIVNIDAVDGVRQEAHGEYAVLLKDRTQIRVGRRFRPRLQARLGQAL